MQFTSSLLLAAAAATGVTSLAVPRQTTPQATPQFNITAFSFSGTPHSVVAYYSLNATYGDAIDSVPVECSTSTNTSPSVSSFNLTACQDPSWSFAFTPQNTSQGTGYSLKLTHLPATAGQKNDTGCVFIPSSDVQTRVDPYAPTGNVDYVNYGPAFSIPYSQMDECVYA